MKGFVGIICACLISLLVFTFPETGSVAHSSSIEPDVTAARLARLRRGINTSHWFAQLSIKERNDKSHFDTHTTAQDIALIKAMGFLTARATTTPSKHDDLEAVLYLGDDGLELLRMI